MTIGTVKFMSSNQGVGRTDDQPGANDLYIRLSKAEAAGLGRLVEGQELSFEVQPERRGRRRSAYKLSQRIA